MRVCILGPVNAPSYYGGVATFDEGLADGLSALGVDVTVFTEQNDVLDGDRCFEIRTIRDSSSFVASVQATRPDMLVASLSYGKFLLDPRVSDGCLTTYYLHGFFDSSYYPRWKVLSGSLFQKLVCAKCDAVVANSAFTAQVNSRRWGIAVDAVIPPGVADGYIRPNAGARPRKANGQVLFIGRLHEAKRVDVLLRAFAAVSRVFPEATLCVAGDGPHSDELRFLAAELGCHVDFLGRVQGDDARELYAHSDVFVSLNDGEPFGITYCEALLSGCRIVCPATGGQTEFLAKRKDRVAFCEDICPDSVASAIIRLLGNNQGLLPVADCRWFSYKRVARDFLSLVDGRNQG